MTQPFFPCTISAQSRNNEFLTIKTVVRKTHQNNGHTGSSCLDKAVLAQGGGGGTLRLAPYKDKCTDHSFTHSCPTLWASARVCKGVGPTNTTDDCIS